MYAKDVQIGQRFKWAGHAELRRVAPTFAYQDYILAVTPDYDVVCIYNYNLVELTDHVPSEPGDGYNWIRTPLD